LENIIVGIILVGFLALTIWGMRVSNEQAQIDAQAAQARRTREKPAQSKRTK